MKAAFLTSSLIASKGKASPASPAMAPRALLDEDGMRDNRHRVSRIYDRVREVSDHHHHSDMVNGEAAALETHRDMEHHVTHTPEAPAREPEDAPEAYSAPETPEQEKAAAGNSLLKRVAEMAKIHKPVHPAEDPTEGASEILESVETAEEVSKELADDQADMQKDALRTTSPAMNGYTAHAPSAPAYAAPVPVQKTDKELPKEEYEQIAGDVSKLKRDSLGRIRISVRLAPKDHLQLKLIAAHTHMSAQSIFEAALEEYVANHGSEILPKACNCVLDKSTL